MRPSLVLLSDRDTDAPQLDAVCTVSKDDQGDRGAYAIGAAAAARGALWVDRAYFTGRADQAWIIGRCKRVTEAGGYFQYGNEPNHPDESWNGPPISYSASFALAQLDYPEGRWLYGPPSPGIEGWRDWVPVGVDGIDYAVHCYGSLEQMIEVVQWYLDNTTGDLYVTECNPGAGNTFDLNAWAQDHFRPFLARCATHERIRMVAYFAWAWDQSRLLPSSIDARGTRVVDVLQAWRPPAVASPSSTTTPTAPRGDPSGSTPAPAPQPTGRSGTMTELRGIDALRDRTWALADEWAAADHPWLSQGLKALVALSKGEG